MTANHRAADVLEVARNCAAQGKGVRDVADHFGVTLDAVYVALKRAGETDLLAALRRHRVRTHGNRATYTAGCRCDPCTDANTAYFRQRRSVHRDPSEIPHGPGGRSNYGCECHACVDASRQATKDRIAFNRGGARNGAAWTEEELAVVLQRKPDGRRYMYSAKEAAIKVGRSVAAVDNRRLVHRRGAA